MYSCTTSVTVLKIKRHGVPSFETARFFFLTYGFLDPKIYMGLIYIDLENSRKSTLISINLKLPKPAIQLPKILVLSYVFQRGYILQSSSICVFSTNDLDLWVVPPFPIRFFVELSTHKSRLLGLVLVTSHHVRGDGKINVNNPRGSDLPGTLVV